MNEPIPLAMRLREAARFLSISPRFLWQLTRDGCIPHVRIGSGRRKTVLYPLVELQAWLTQQVTKPAGGEK
jgi:excisionase family DNA binding protein